MRLPRRFRRCLSHLRQTKRTDQGGGSGAYGGDKESRDPAQAVENGVGHGTQEIHVIGLVG